MKNLNAVAVIVVLLVMVLVVSSSCVFAEQPGKEDLAKAAQNPLASMISLPLQNNTNFNYGPSDDTQNILNVQPVWPFKLSEDWNLISRTIIPIISQPSMVPGQETISGLGDINFTGFIAPAKASKIIWGVGPSILAPTASDNALGADKWGLGPSVIVMTMPGNWIVGSLVNNIWSVGGSGETDVNSFLWQYFVNYFLPNGWYLTSAPIITANWEAESGQQWTVPFGGGFGKVFKIGKQPINGQISAYKNVEKPDFGADLQLRVQLQFLFPK